MDRGRREKFFFRGNSPVKNNNRGTLIINDNECSDPERISSETYSFYSNLYSSNFSPDATEIFFDKMKDFISQINEDFRMTVRQRSHIRI